MRLHHVAVLALDDVIPLDFALPVQVFAELPYREPSARELPYRMRVCALNPMVRSTAGFSITRQVGLRWLARADTVVVPGFEPHGRTLDPAVLSALRRAHARGARMISICVGAFALAQAGILDGRPAPTHWRFAAALAQQFPAVDVRADVLYVDDGDVLTSAGVSSGLDLCLHVVRTDLGVEEAGHVAQGLVAAARCAMSTRTLTRHVREATGTTPLQWLLTMRIDKARQLLEATDLAIDEVAERAGFGTGLKLRTHFLRSLDTAPTTYRRNFRAPADATRHEAV